MRRSLFPLVLATAALALLDSAEGAPPGGLVISEVNPRGAEFVELHNASDSVAYLTSYTLVGDVKHIFEDDISIVPGGYLIIATGYGQIEDAFGKEVIIGDTLWGRLSAKGGELRLYGPRYELVDWVRYDRAQPGLSHQLRSATSPYRGPLNWGQAPPTPAAPNAVPDAPPALALDRPTRTPEAPRPGEEAEVTVQVYGVATAARIEWETAGGQVGSAPLEAVDSLDSGAGKTYRGGLPGLPSETLIDYRVVAEGPSGSVTLAREERTATPLRYYVLDAQAEETLPILRFKADPQEVQRLLDEGGSTQATLVLAEHEGAADVVEGVLLEARGGEGIRRWSKRSWRVRLPRQARGLGGRREVFLRTTWRDPTHLRELLSLTLLRRCGLVAPQARLVILQVNGEYVGLYTEVEAVDADFLDHHYLADAALFQARQPRGKPWKRPSLCDGRPLPSPLDYELSWARRTPASDYADLIAFIEGLDAQDDEELQGFFEEHLDVDQYVTYLAAIALVGHWDNTNRNFFWCLDRAGSGKWSVLPWDLDRTLGDHYHGRWLVFDTPLGLGTDSLPVRWSGKETSNRLRTRFLEVPALQERYRERLLELVKTVFEPARLEAEIALLSRKVQAEVLRDRARWSQTRSKIDGRRMDQTFTPFHFARGVQHLERYVRERAHFVARACEGGEIDLSTKPLHRAQASRELGSLLALLLGIGGVGLLRLRKRASL